MNIAVRVLTAINKRLPQDAADLAALKALADPLHENLDTDELACEVIKQALKHRAAVRDDSRRNPNRVGG